MSADFSSRVYKPDPQKCCERCVFGTGEHAEWCDRPLKGSDNLADLAVDAMFEHVDAAHLDFLQMESRRCR